MNKQERQALQEAITEVDRWVSGEESVRAQRSTTATAGRDAVQSLLRAVVNVRRDGRKAWSVLPLGPEQHGHLVAMARHKHLPAILGEETQALAQLPETVPAAIRDAQVVLGARRFFSGRERKNVGAGAVRFLTEYVAWGREAGILQILDRIAPRWDEGRELTAVDALSDVVGLRSHLARFGAPELVGAAPATGLLDAIRTIDRAVKDEAGFRKAAIDAGIEVRKAETRRTLTTMPVERIKEATRERLRISPLTDSGIATVLEVLDYTSSLDHLPGIGSASAARILGAARTLEQTTFDEMPMRIDIKNRGTEATEFLRRLGAWDAARKLKNATSDLQRAKELTDLALTLTRRHTHLVVASSAGLDAQEFLAGVNAVISRAAQLGSTTSTATTTHADPWDDFMARPVDYFGMLTELGFVYEDETKAHGDLPEEIVEAVRAMSLNTEHLTVSTLRGYQSFGARFALVQRKVILGDEMGLGKTIEALAVLARMFHGSAV